MATKEEKKALAAKKKADAAKADKKKKSSKDKKKKKDKPSRDIKKQFGAKQLAIIIHANSPRIMTKKKSIALAKVVLKEYLIDPLLEGINVRIPILGSLQLVTRAARKGHNPQTNESIQIPERTSVKLKKAKTIKALLAREKGEPLTDRMKIALEKYDASVDAYLLYKAIASSNDGDDDLPTSLDDLDETPKKNKKKKKSDKSKKKEKEEASDEEEVDSNTDSDDDDDEEVETPKKKKKEKKNKKKKQKEVIEEEEEEDDSDFEDDDDEF